jgi:hypothetical protein
MRAQEVQRECVVRAFGGTRLGLGEQTFLSAAPGDVGAGEVEELPPGHGDEPGLGIGWGLGPPPDDGFDQCFLNGVLGRREVGSAADEDAEHRGNDLP